MENEYKYQLVVLGKIEKNVLKNIKTEIEKSFGEIGISYYSHFKLIDKKNLLQLNEKNPVFCLYFGHSHHLDIREVKSIKEKGIAILPIVSDLKLFNKEIPICIREKNGLELNSKQSYIALNNIILENFSLLSENRKIFISYKRDESLNVALQLDDVFSKRGFDVFLDSKSISKAKNFQEELFHKMMDCDIILMLDTPHFFDSKWCLEEFKKANSKSIYIVKVSWPDQDFNSLSLKAKKNYDNKHAALLYSRTLTLKVSSFTKFLQSSNKRHLNKKTISEIINIVESTRARAVAQRRNNLYTTIAKTAADKGINCLVIPDKSIILRKKSSKTFIKPVVGIPQSTNFQSSMTMTNTYSNVFLAYDSTNIKKEWLNYLDWLNKSLPIKTKKIDEVETWVK